MVITKFLGFIIFAGLVGFGTASVQAEGATPAAKGPVALTIMSSSGKAQFTLSEIEALGLHDVTTRSPWETGQFKFKGVLLRDVLRLAGVETAAAVTVRGDDGYAQTIPRDDWEKWPLLLATRQDGEVLTTRTQGPTRIVYPLEDYPELDTLEYKPRWVWAIASIEAAP